MPKVKEISKIMRKKLTEYILGRVLKCGWIMQQDNNPKQRNKSYESLKKSKSKVLE